MVHPENQTHGITTLIWCVCGIYLPFLSWSYFHESITVSRYNGEKFQAPLFIQLVQSFFACSFGLGYLYSKQPKGTSLHQFKNSLYLFYSDRTLLYSLFSIAITQSLAGPIGNTSLNHIDFVTYLLAKSCKLIPVLIIHTFYYKRRFPALKYYLALLITLGVFLFSYKKSKPGSAATGGSMLTGIGYLFVSLMLDGITNASQDQLFKRFKNMTGIHLMIALNFISFFLLLVYSTVFTNQLVYSFNFIWKHPDLFYTKILGYTICGSLGQIFIFQTLEYFSSLVLITINVTRKMASMVLSLVLFNHPLSAVKALGIFLVFFAIGIESYLKFSQKPAKVKAN